MTVYKITIAVFLFSDTNVEEENHYFTLSNDGIVKLRKRAVMLKSFYTYNSKTKTTSYYRESRPAQITIESISEDEVTFSGVDYLKSKISSVYASEPWLHLVNDPDVYHEKYCRHQQCESTASSTGKNYSPMLLCATVRSRHPYINLIRYNYKRQGDDKKQITRNEQCWYRC